jgi:hypothetical protein
LFWLAFSESVIDVTDVTGTFAFRQLASPGGVALASVVIEARGAGFVSATPA